MRSANQGHLTAFCAKAWYGFVNGPTLFRFVAAPECNERPDSIVLMVGIYFAQFLERSEFTWASFTSFRTSMRSLQVCQFLWDSEQNV
jgi:hypothetical protein